MVPLQAWLRENQPDIFATEEKRRTGLTFATVTTMIRMTLTPISS